MARQDQRAGEPEDAVRQHGDGGELEGEPQAMDGGRVVDDLHEGGRARPEGLDHERGDWQHQHEAEVEKNAAEQQALADGPRTDRSVATHAPPP